MENYELIIITYLHYMNTNWVRTYQRTEDAEEHILANLAEFVESLPDIVFSSSVVSNPSNR